LREEVALICLTAKPASIALPMELALLSKPLWSPALPTLTAPTDSAFARWLPATRSALDHLITTIHAHRRMRIWIVVWPDPIALLQLTPLNLAATRIASRITKRPSLADALSPMISMEAAITTNIAVGSPFGLSL